MFSTELESLYRRSVVGTENLLLLK